MYNNNIYDDISYLLNKDIIFNNIPKIIKYTKLGNKNTSFDDYSRWQDAYIFDENRVLNEFPRLEKKDDLPLNYYIDLAKENMDINIKPLIEENPNTNFYLFFPPYSILFWYSCYMNGELESYLELEEFIISNLLNYDNVKLYYFQNDKEIICNLNNYKDYSHYSSDINSYIAKSISIDNYLLTIDNYKENLSDMKKLVLNYDFEKLLK